MAFQKGKIFASPYIQQAATLGIDEEVLD